MLKRVNIAASLICRNCGATKSIKPNSIYHRSAKCSKCHLPTPNLNKFQDYLKETNWKCVDMPKVQTDKIILICALCQNTKILNYKSFISKRIDCGHPTIEKHHQIKQIIESLGFTTILIPMGTDSRTLLEAYCHGCRVQLTISIAGMRKGCPNCLK